MPASAVWLDVTVSVGGDSLMRLCNRHCNDESLLQWQAADSWLTGGRGKDDRDKHTAAAAAAADDDDEGDANVWLTASARRHTSAAVCSAHFLDFSLQQTDQRTYLLTYLLALTLTHRHRPNCDCCLSVVSVDCHQVTRLTSQFTYQLCVCLC